MKVSICKYVIRHWNSLNSNLTPVIHKRDCFMYTSYEAFLLRMLTAYISGFNQGTRFVFDLRTISGTSAFIWPIHYWTLKLAEFEESYENTFNITFNFSQILQYTPLTFSEYSLSFLFNHHNRFNSLALH